LLSNAFQNYSITVWSYVVLLKLNIQIVEIVTSQVEKSEEIRKKKLILNNVAPILRIV
jgi:hypothetical protein